MADQAARLVDLGESCLRVPAVDNLEDFPSRDSRMNRLLLVPLADPAAESDASIVAVRYPSSEANDQNGEAANV